MPKRNLLRDYETEYLANRAKIEKSLESLAIKRRNDSILTKIKTLEEDKDICIYKMFNECEKLRKSLKPVPSVPSNIKDMKEPEDMSEVDLHNYFDIEIFHDCVMFNISPNWKGECSSLEHRCRIEFLKIILDKFYNDANRFTKYKYVKEMDRDWET